MCKAKVLLSKSKTTSHGFTLIKMLVVVAIFVLLAAILLPVFDRAQENAIRSTCQSNLKQLGLAFEQYAQDYDDRYPVLLVDNDGNPCNENIA